jgi:hypothetical protein
VVYGRWVQLQMLIPCSSQYMQRNAATACPSRMFSNASFDAPVAVASTGLTYVGFLGGGGGGRGGGGPPAGCGVGCSCSFHITKQSPATMQCVGFFDGLLVGPLCHPLCIPTNVYNTTVCCMHGVPMYLCAPVPPPPSVSVVWYMYPQQIRLGQLTSAYLCAPVPLPHHPV